MTEPAAPAAAPARSRYRRLLTPAIAVVCVAVAGAFLVAGLAARADNGPAATAAPEGYGAAPTYRLIDQNGRSVSSSEFAGKVQVVSFLFPYCHSYCPLIARTMAEVADEVAGGPLRTSVHLVTFNVDPKGAGPAVLRKYIAQYGGHPDDPTWDYLTGTPAQVRRTVTGGFHIYFNKVSLAYENKQIAEQERQTLRQDMTAPNPQPYTPPPWEPNPLADQAHVNYDVVHDDYVEIVNRTGQIIAVFDQASTLTRDQLLAAVKDALADRPIPLQQVP